MTRAETIAALLAALGYRVTLPGEGGWYVMLRVGGEPVRVHACERGGK